MNHLELDPSCVPVGLGPGRQGHYLVCLQPTRQRLQGSMATSALRLHGVAVTVQPLLHLVLAHVLVRYGRTVAGQLAQRLDARHAVLSFGLTPPRPSDPWCVRACVRACVCVCVCVCVTYRHTYIHTHIQGGEGSGAVALCRGAAGVYGAGKRDWQVETGEQGRESRQGIAHVGCGGGAWSFAGVCAGCRLLCSQGRVLCVCVRVFLCVYCVGQRVALNPLAPPSPFLSLSNTGGDEILAVAVGHQVLKRRLAWCSPDRRLPGSRAAAGSARIPLLSHCTGLRWTSCRPCTGSVYVCVFVSERDVSECARLCPSASV